MQSLEKKEPITENGKHLILELTVNNHPGVMSHICGLFARRAFNMEGILCLPAGKGEMSRIWIKVEQNGQIGQIVKQLRKLEDVREVLLHGTEHQLFVRLEEYFTAS
jgi:acetolactate synthase-1/3 small subunit